ncbi:unnamed protein product, partial [Brachionus calyciflorus]
ITVDTWTSCQNYNYIGVTCYYLENFSFKSFAIGFNSMVGSHSSENLKESIVEILDKLGLRNKIFSTVSDNAPNMRRTNVELALDHEPVKSIGHVFQLIVKNLIDKQDETFRNNDGQLEDDQPLKTYDFVGRILSKCRGIVSSFNYSTQLKDIL